MHIDTQSHIYTTHTSTWTYIHLYLENLTVRMYCIIQIYDPYWVMFFKNSKQSLKNFIAYQLGIILQDMYKVIAVYSNKVMVYRYSG